MDQQQIERELAAVEAEIRGIGPYLEGNLLCNKKARYVKKDGTESFYATAPVLQYRTGPGKRRSKRVAPEALGRVRELLAAGARMRTLRARHRELAAALALDPKKKA
jgi:hypothetical protein